MQKDLLEAMLSYDKELAHNVILLEEEIDKIFFLVRRQLDLAINNAMLMKVLDLNSSTCITFAFLIKEIEGISDHLVKLAEGFVALEKPLAKAILFDIKQLSELARELSVDIMRALSRKDNKLANTVFLRQKKLEKIRRKLSMKSHKLPTNERFLVELIASEFCSIINHSGEMAKIVIDELSRLEK